MNSKISQIKTGQWYSAANGLFSSVAQIIIIRELFAVFSGNEFLLSISLSVWLLSSALGNRISPAFLKIKLPWLIFLYLLSSVGAIFVIRAMPGFLFPGELYSPVLITGVVVLAEVPCSLLAGTLFGVLASNNYGKLLYRWDNAGTIAGLTLISCAIYYNTTHLLIILLSAAFLLPALWKKRFIFSLAIASLLIFLLIEPQSNIWKYKGRVSSVIYGREGEIAIDNDRNVILLNNRVYRTGYPLPFIEQAVHVPLSIRGADRILLIHDNGHSTEIRKYNPSELVCLESEPVLADTGCICQTPERLPIRSPFDAVLVGCDVPENIAMSRLFTDGFFYRVKEMMTDSGLFSFTLSLNSNYLNTHEKKLKDLMAATLSRTFRFVKVFPAEGWTFVASDIPFEFPTECKVPNSYFNDFILPAVTPEKIISANLNIMNAGINKVAHPLILKFTLESYLEKFNISIPVTISVAVILIVTALLVFLRRSVLFSVGTTGFCAGAYTIVIMMMYQSMYGTLYSRISLLMISLNAGFVIGTFLKKLPHTDIIVGFYTVFSLFFLIVFRNPPEMLFYLFNCVMGAIASAQIINSRDVSWRKLNAADLVGGVVGMGLTAIFILPGFGLKGVIITMAIVKAVSLIGHFHIITPWKPVTGSGKVV